MSKRPGYYLQYTDKEGKIQKAIAYHDEQDDSYKRQKRVFIRLIDDRFQPKIDPDTGKKLVSLKYASDFKIIGFLD
jgi:hypothetical protein